MSLIGGWKAWIRGLMRHILHLASASSWEETWCAAVRILCPCVSNGCPLAAIGVGQMPLWQPESPKILIFTGKMCQAFAETPATWAVPRAVPVDYLCAQHPSWAPLIYMERCLLTTDNSVFKFAFVGGFRVCVWDFLPLFLGLHLLCFALQVFFCFQTWIWSPADLYFHLNSVSRVTGTVPVAWHPLV